MDSGPLGGIRSGGLIIYMGDEPVHLLGRLLLSQWRNGKQVVIYPFDLSSTKAQPIAPWDQS